MLYVENKRNADLKSSVSELTVDRCIEAVCGRIRAQRRRRFDKFLKPNAFGMTKSRATDRRTRAVQSAVSEREINPMWCKKSQQGRKVRTIRKGERKETCGFYQQTKRYCDIVKTGILSIPTGAMRFGLAYSHSSISLTPCKSYLIRNHLEVSLTKYRRNSRLSKSILLEKNADLKGNPQEEPGSQEDTRPEADFFSRKCQTSYGYRTSGRPRFSTRSPTSREFRASPFGQEIQDKVFEGNNRGFFLVK